MWTHFFTLRTLASELSQGTVGAAITEVFTQRKDELLVTIRKPEGAEHTIVVSVHPQLNFMFMRDRLPRARRNSVDLFPEALGGRITEVSARLFERVIFIRLVGNNLLCIQLFGTAESNVFLVDESGTIVNSFKNKKKFQEKPFPFEGASSAMATVPDTAAFSDSLLRDDRRSLFAALKPTVPFLGSTYAREAIHRLGFDEKLPVRGLRPEDVRALYSQCLRLIEESGNPRPTVYFRNDEPRVFSVVPLQHLAGARTLEYESVNAAIRSTVFRTLRTHDIESSKSRIIHRLKTEYDRTLRSSAAAKDEVAQADRAAGYERIGGIIMANLAHLTKGTKFVELEDIFSDKRPLVRIDLDPKLNPVQNAERYFAKSRRARSARAELEQRVAELEEKSVRLNKFLLHIDQCRTKEQLDEFQKDNAPLLRRWNIAPEGDRDKFPPFRIFTVAGSFEVWVGKSSANNELLTMKYARPNDLWFHVRGAGGSHTVLRMKDGKHMPSKEAISQAAGIAAYYSKMRNASAVPVAYCERKFVRKPKGAETGAVVMNREKVIFVEPRLP